MRLPNQTRSQKTFSVVVGGRGLSCNSMFCSFFSGWWQLSFCGPLDPLAWMQKVASFSPALWPLPQATPKDKKTLQKSKGWLQDRETGWYKQRASRRLLPLPQASLNLSCNYTISNGCSPSLKKVRKHNNKFLAAAEVSFQSLLTFNMGQKQSRWQLVKTWGLSIFYAWKSAKRNRIEFKFIFHK